MTAPILVGVALRDDDSAPLALARDLARYTGAPLALVNVYPYEPMPRLPSAEYDAMLREDALVGLNEAAQALRDEFEVSVHAEGSRSPVRGLHDAALALDASMLVVGSSHRGALRRVMPGGVGERLLHAAPRAVALAPRGYEGDKDSIRRVASPSSTRRRAMRRSGLPSPWRRSAGRAVHVHGTQPPRPGAVAPGRVPPANYSPTSRSSAPNWTYAISCRRVSRQRSRSRRAPWPRPGIRVRAPRPARLRFARLRSGPHRAARRGLGATGAHHNVPSDRGPALLRSRAHGSAHILTAIASAHSRRHSVDEPRQLWRRRLLSVR